VTPHLILGNGSEQEGGRRKCALPHSPPAQLGPACHSSQEPGSTWGRKTRPDQRLARPVLLPRKNPHTLAARESREAATAQVIGLGACMSQDKLPFAAHAPSQRRGDGCHTADQTYGGPPTRRGLCLGCINRAGTEETPHSSLAGRKPARLAEAQP